LRYHVVSLVRALLLQGEDLASAVAAVAAASHPDASGELHRLSKRTVYRWVAAYQRTGPASLEDAKREGELASRVLCPGLLEFLANERKGDPDGSIPELLRRAEQEGHLDSWQDVDRSTVYRALVRMGVPTARRKKERGRDMRRFLCDGVHFRAGATRKKRVAEFFLCDCTRFGLHVVVGTSESAHLFLRGFHEVLRRYGKMSALYIDNGPGFRANDVAEVCRRLNLALIHGEVKYPEGHGKIERLNQTVRASLLRSLDGRAEVDPTCEALELRLQHWLREVYNHTPHESLRCS
jgi:transposase InsO family protein